jgi:hypothetical protein
MSLFAIVKILEGIGLIAALFMKEAPVVTEGVIKIVEGIKGEEDAKTN